MRKLLILMVFLMTVSFAVEAKSSAPIEKYSCEWIDTALEVFLNKAYPHRDKRADAYTLLEWRYITINDLEKKGIPAGRDCPPKDLLTFEIMRQIYGFMDATQARKKLRKIDHHQYHNEQLTLHWIIPAPFVGMNPFPYEFWFKQCRKYGPSTTVKMIPGRINLDGIMVEAITYICMTPGKGTREGPRNQTETPKEWWDRQDKKLRL